MNFTDEKDYLMRMIKEMVSVLFSLMLGKKYTSVEFEYSNAIVHAFQKFRAPFSGKIVHIFPEQSAVI